MIIWSCLVVAERIGRAATLVFERRDIYQRRNLLWTERQR